MPPHIEDERRWLLELFEFPDELVKHSYTIEQGYMQTVDGKSFRVRIINDRQAQLCVKSGTGESRLEFETALPGKPNSVSLEFGRAVYKACPYKIRKKRYYLIGGWELDLFRGPLNGIAVLEFERKHSRKPWPGLPDWVIAATEVTTTLTSYRLAWLVKHTKHFDLTTRLQWIMCKYCKET